jgi:TolB protein
MESALPRCSFATPPGANTHEVESNISAPKTVRIEKRGDYFYAFVSGKDGKLQPAGASTKLALTGDFYIGIGVCAHDKDVVEKAVFSNVISSSFRPHPAKPLVSSLETIAIASTDRHVEYVAAAHFEAPNWSRDGKYPHLQPGGNHPPPGLRRAASPRSFLPRPQIHCNNDHGISPDGQFSPSATNPPTTTNRASTLFPSPAARRGSSRPTRRRTGTAGRPTARLSPSLASAETTSTFIPSAAAEERKPASPPLPDSTTAPSTRPTAHISTSTPSAPATCRSGACADGSAQEQVTFDDSNNWFPHLSPDGQTMAFLAYEKGVTGHPPGKDVELRLMTLKDKKVRVLAKLFGGQGTINVPSWSPEGLKLAFVSYQLLPEESLISK